MADSKVVELLALLDQVRVLQKNVIALESNARESTKLTEKTMFSSLAGEQANVMLASPENARMFLNHADWKMRLAAMNALSIVWKPSEDVPSLFERIAFSDPNEQVRGTAIHNLAWALRGTNDPRTGMLLRGVVYNAEPNNRMREAAYLGLFILRGLPFTAWPIPGKFNFPEAVDWSFVDSFLPEHS